MPSRTRFALPMGTVYGSSSGHCGFHCVRSPSGASIIFDSALSSPGSPGIGSSPFMRRSALGSRNMTGFGS